MVSNLAFQKATECLAPLFLVLMLSGCGEFKKLDDMRESTDEMNQTTKELLEQTKLLLEQTKELQKETQKVSSQTERLGDTTDRLRDTTGQLLNVTRDDLARKTAELGEMTERLGETTDELLDVTRNDLLRQMKSVDRGFGELYDAMRQGDSASLRRESIQRLLEAKTLQNRMAEAGLFVMSFEYQLFSGVGQDVSPARKNLLYQQAAMEFFLRIDELAPKGEKIEPLANPDPAHPTSQENRASAFNCLASALHKTNRKQEIDSETRERVSLYDLIIKAMRMKEQLNTGRLRLPDGPHFAKEVLARPARVRQLLQARHNMFALLFLGATTDLIAKGRLARGVSAVRGIEIDFGSSDMGAAHLDFIIEEILRPAIETRDDMIALGLKPELAKTVRFLASRVSFKAMPADQGSKLLKSRQTLIQELWEDYLR